jgi:hypothetical protein
MTPEWMWKSSSSGGLVLQELTRNLREAATDLGNIVARCASFLRAQKYMSEGISIAASLILAQAMMNFTCGGAEFP